MSEEISHFPVSSLPLIVARGCTYATSSGVISYTRTAIRCKSVTRKRAAARYSEQIMQGGSGKLSFSQVGRSGRLISFSVDCQILVPHCETRMEHQGDRCIPVVSSGRKDQQ